VRFCTLLLFAALSYWKLGVLAAAALSAAAMVEGALLVAALRRPSDA
jgi:hypothetical protein